MIIREVLNINGRTIFRTHSDSGVYIRNKADGTLWTTVNSSIDFEYEETDTPIEKEAENENT